VPFGVNSFSIITIISDRLILLGSKFINVQKNNKVAARPAITNHILLKG
jgi:hypothetical protein